MQGCPWGCRYCHNAHLRTFKSKPEPRYAWQEIRKFLTSRIGFLDGLVFSGGEPTAQIALPHAIREAKSLGYSIGLHTAGAYPERLAEILPLLDWIGLDIKAPFDERYERITGATGSADRVRESLRLVQQSGIRHQLRTTVHPLLLGAQDLEDLQNQLQELGAAPSTHQQFRVQGCQDAELVAAA